MAKSNPTPGASDPEVAKAIQAVRDQFGLSEFDAMRVLVGAGAEKIAKESGAKALATGNHVTFSEDRSQKTAAHEATHTLQQRPTSFASVGEIERAAKQADYFKKSQETGSDGSNH